MVINAKNVKAVSESIYIRRRLRDAEQLIDAELQGNADRLEKGKAVMIPCIMPYELYSNLIRQYAENGWKVRHEKINAYGRLYFTKAKNV